MSVKYDNQAIVLMKKFDYTFYTHIYKSLYVLKKHPCGLIFFHIFCIYKLFFHFFVLGVCVKYDIQAVVLLKKSYYSFHS